jgi:hypothetical protein
VLEGWWRRGKPFAWAVGLGIASLIPCGTFYLDRELARDDEEFRTRLWP